MHSYRKNEERFYFSFLYYTVCWHKVILCSVENLSLNLLEQAKSEPKKWFDDFDIIISIH